MERSPGDRPSPSAQDQPSAPSDPPGQPPTAPPKPDLSSGDQPAGPGAAGEALAVLTSFGRRLLVLVPVYLAGAMGLSVGFVLFGLALYLGWRRVRDGKERSLRVARQLLDDEERLTAETLYMSHRELPAWVSFPDVEKVEWLNKIVAQVWPFLGQYMEKLLAETVAPSVRGSNPHLQTFTFTRVELGEKPLRILGVKVHPGQNKQQILLDLNISYVGDIQIDVEVKKYFCKAGVKGMQLHGVLRVILEPLIGDLPIVGAVSMFFIRRPTLDINWTGMTNLLDIPGLSSLSDTMIMDSIAAFLVLPNRLLVPLVPDLHDVAQLRSPLPRGIIRIHLLAARGLSSKDKYVKGLIEGKSDPYAIVRVGTQTFCSRVIDEELNPQWGETYEVMVHEVPGQEVEVEVFDKDPDKDDFLGRMKLDVGKVLQAGVLDDWFPLQGGQGQVHLKLEWLSLLPDAEKLEQVLQWNRGVSSRPEPPSAAILVVYLDRAQDLPLKKGNKEPNPMVQLSVQDVTRESKAVYNNNCPVWEEAFRFFLQDPQSQELDVQVKDDSRALALGALTLPLARLLTASELTLDQWFQLSSSGPNSRLYMKLVMRVWRWGALRVWQGLVRSLALTVRQGEAAKMKRASICADAYIMSKQQVATAIMSVRAPSSSDHSAVAPQVRGEGTGALGSLSLPLSELLGADQLCVDRWFTLNNGQGQVLLRAQLGILVSQHSGVEAHSHSHSYSSSSVSEELEPWGGLPHTTSSAPELRQRLTHGDSPLEAPAGPLGQVKLTVWYYSEERKLISIVHSCRSLRQNGRDPPDPYVSLLLHPDKNRGTKRKTSQKKRTLNPEFNERFEWELPLDEALRRKLDVSVKSNSSFMSRERELLGKVQLDLAETDLSQGAAQWYDLLDDKDKGSS
ncbi:extended synaptotagmin-1 [Myotis lucifugus]|uniref:extended synaptotagmin-1 n=1 Tax=Myotis lucifugus TaxID=59463 RepID=UPI000CCC00D7|nr:extended synaptotagmin-1 [Myotis lucifugus]